MANLTKINIALEWFMNPDHLPLLVAKHNGYLYGAGIDLNIVVPDEHYDGFDALKRGEIEFAINEPLHLIEQFDDNMLSLGTFFATRGGILITTEGDKKLKNGEPIRITTPVDNPKTDAIAMEILHRYLLKNGVTFDSSKVPFDKTDFYHISHIKDGYDACWLAFYNFEGIEAAYEGIDCVMIDANTGGFPNFSALNIFTTKEYYGKNQELCSNLLKNLERSINFICCNPSVALDIYYKESGEEQTELMDRIIMATIKCFELVIVSKASNEEPILEFFHSINITNLPKEEFKGAFLN